MSTCQLCEAPAPLSAFDIPESPAPAQIQLCGICKPQLETDTLEGSHFQSVTTTMWSEDNGVQVMAYRVLKQLSSEAWAQEALDMLYLEDDIKAWAEAGIKEAPIGGPTRDSNGAILKAGDTVTLIKDLAVKGAGFTAKRGTVVRGITLTDNPEHIEGKVNGQRIVLVSAYLKKA